MGYPVELNRHNALTFSHGAAPGLTVLGPATTAKDRHQPLYANNE